MRFCVSSRIEYEVRSPLILLLNIRAHASEPQRIVKETFTISPKVESELVVTEPDKNRFDRVKVTKAKRVRIDYRAEVAWQKFGAIRDAFRTLRQEVKCQVLDEKLFHPLSEEEMSGTAVSLDIKQI